MNGKGTQHAAARQRLAEAGMHAESEAGGGLMPGDEWTWQLACFVASEAHQLHCHVAERVGGGG